MVLLAWRSLVLSSVRQGNQGLWSSAGSIPTPGALYHSHFSVFQFTYCTLPSLLGWDIISLQNRGDAKKKKKKNDVTMMSSHIWFLWNSHTYLQSAYQNGISNFRWIKHTIIEIYSREVNKELWRKKKILSHCDLWPKVTNFNRVRASVLSNRLVKTASKSVYPFGWNFVHK